MSEERNIEKQLRDYAKKRRAEIGDPFQMHGATRNLLQREVAKQADAGGRKNNLSPWLIFFRWPGFAVTFSVMVALAVIVPVLTKMDKRFELAKEIPKSPPAARPELSGARDKDESKLSDSPQASPIQSAVSVAEIAAANRRSETDGLLKHGKQEESSAQKNLLAVSAMPEKAKEKLSATSGSVDFTAGEKPSGNASISSAVTNTSATSALFAEADRNKSDVLATYNYALVGGGSQSQPASGKYVQQAGGLRSRVAKDSNGQMPLSSFEVVRIGNEIKIVDADGSIYKGQITSAERTDTGKKLPEANSSTRTAGVAGAPMPSQSFQAAGTNRTLNVQVVVSAWFFEEFNGAIGADSELKTAARKPAATGTNLQPAQTSGAVISGTVRVGLNEFPINARKVSP